MPNERHASVNSARARMGSRTSTTGTRMVANVRPVPAKALRTRVGDPPRAIRRSLSHPENTHETAIATNGSQPNNAIFVLGKWRSFSKYAGSQLIRKYQ